MEIRGNFGIMEERGEMEENCGKMVNKRKKEVQIFRGHFNQGLSRSD